MFEKCFQYTTPQDIRNLGIYPYFRPVQSAPGNEVVIDGKECIMIGSNNYLGLVNHPKVKEAAAAAALKYGSGCTGSRFLNGTLDLHIELEHRLAKFMQREAALVFSTGFQTNLGTISTLVGKSDAVFIDRQDHACIVDGTRLSYGKIYKFAHNDIDDYERVVKNVVNNGHRGGMLVVVDGVFSMEGDIIDLPRLVEVSQRYDVRVMVDDAHSVGVLGETGAGTAEHFGLLDKVDITMGTFSKSFASLGGFIVADAAVIEWVKHTARALIFSASIPPSNAAAVLAALDIIETEPERREHLWKNAHRMKREFAGLGFDVGRTETPIVPIVIGGDIEAFEFWKALFDRGVFTNPVVSPAVPPGQAMIRTSYTATHTDEHLDRVVEIVAQVGREKGLIS
ncbi:MAG: pyridoxal phosphate-dependent aminotransferase family protein [candidate division Zixibacteria bacterium]|nr:pyridoxal phosphate-dependent aminotransferase family protein [candidate division Zixibacteria bacterium]MDH3937749.1 pyridoxal phosphate-dependent aminotransferase family protein [candidate division Zixibacteria bacterium]MDH4032854.1 pyridoxal phosphate-dependent aminotransferase family protein [candidate division Zixibacteria bacterium]